VEAGAGGIAEGRQELQEDGSGMGFGMRGERTDELAGKAVQGGFGEAAVGKPRERDRLGL
jgi:hypothetical protein